VSTLAHIFEEAGLATITLGSIRQQIENTAPPRGLWCDFPLGRPLGVPGDARFQHRVLSHALSLLDAREPVFDVYPEVVDQTESTSLSCPLPPRSNTDLHPALDEVRGLRPAYDRAVEKYGDRAGAGRVVSADEIEEAVGAFIRIAEGTEWKAAGVPGIPARVAQDIRGYYEVAALGLSDHIPEAWAGANWFLDKTESGRIMLEARTVMQKSGVKQPLWFFLTPMDRP